MNLEEAIEYLKDYADWVNGMNPSYHDTMSVAIDTVLRTIKIKDEYLKLLNDMLIDYDGWHTAESLKELIDETRDYIHKALKNDDKSAIYSAGNFKSSNILGEVVEE